MLICYFPFVQSIIENDKKMRYSEDRIVTIEQEVTKLDKKLVQQESSIESLSKILKTIETFVEAAEKKALTVDQAVASLKQLQVWTLSIYISIPKFKAKDFQRKFNFVIQENKRIKNYKK